MKVLIIIGLLLLVLLEYSMCVISHDADERAERMYRKWKEQLEHDIQTNGEPIDSDYNVGIDHAVCVLGAMKGADDEQMD